MLLQENQKQGDALEVSEDDRYITIKNNSVNYIYNKLDGLFKEIIYEGRKIITKPVEINIWRAPTDNDIRIKQEWYAAHYDKSITRAYKTEYKIEEDGVKIHSIMSVAAVTIQRILDIDTIWTVRNTGEISVTMDVKKDKEFPELPRFGLRFFLDGCMENVSYYGIGPYESYIDKCRAGRHGLFNAKAENMHEDYIRPQENGSHADCDYVSVNGDGKALQQYHQNHFQLTCHYIHKKNWHRRNIIMNWKSQDVQCFALIINKMELVQTAVDLYFLTNINLMRRCLYLG